MKTEFQELYKKFLEIYWDGDINNALKLDDNSRERHQHAVEYDIDNPETISSFAEKRSMGFSGRVDHIYDHKEDGSRTVYLEKVFIVDEGTNVLRFEFEGRISYPPGAPIPCEPGGTYSFNGRIAYAHFSWSHMNPRHIYAGYGFKNDVDFLDFEIALEDATCVRASESEYSGRSFGLPGGERFRQKRPPTGKSSGSTSGAEKTGCFIATAAYGVDYNDELRVLNEFRDHALMKSSLGRQCVSLYYVLSPPLARRLARSSWLRARVRKHVLDPIVSLISRRYSRASETRRG